MPRLLPLVCLAVALAGVTSADSAIRVGATECSVDFQARNANLDCTLAIAGGRLAPDGTLALTTAVPGGETATFGYDAQGRLVRADVGGRSTSYSYDSAGRIAAFVGPSRETVPYEYDALDRLVTAGGSRFEYSTNGLTSAAGDGLDAHYTYDDRGNLVAVADHEDEMRFAYDSHRRVTLVGETTAYEYDEGDLVRRTRDGRVTEYGYDRRGNLLRVAGAEIASFSYDTDGSVLQASEQGSVTSFGYDRGGRLIGIFDSDGGITELGYDGEGRLDLVVPAIADEVLISFEQGEIRRPLIVGGLWTDAHGHSFSLTLRGRVKTCSTCP